MEGIERPPDRDDDGLVSRSQEKISVGRRGGISIEQGVGRAKGTVGWGKQADATSNVENAPTGRYGTK